VREEKRGLLQNKTYQFSPFAIYSWDDGEKRARGRAEHLIEHLREHPELMERFQSILQISANAEGPVKSADEVEGLLIEETRRLGNARMGDWASSADVTVFFLKAGIPLLRAALCRS
jgi:hypothetical protein